MLFHAPHGFVLVSSPLVGQPALPGLQGIYHRKGLSADGELGVLIMQAVLASVPELLLGCGICMFFNCRLVVSVK